MEKSNILQLVNQCFEIESKLKETDKWEAISRNITRINAIWEDNGLVINNPYGELYNESRTDYEASIAGKMHDKLKIAKVLKPIVYKTENGAATLWQKGIVIVE